MFNIQIVYLYETIKCVLIFLKVGWRNTQPHAALDRQTFLHFENGCKLKEPDLCDDVNRIYCPVVGGAYVVVRYRRMRCFLVQSGADFFGRSSGFNARTSCQPRVGRDSSSYCALALMAAVCA
jgi:hypothetical protein